MSTIDGSLLLSGIAPRARGASPSPLRVVLVQGEALRLPRSTAALAVLSGTAWVSQAGRESVLQAGEQFLPADGRDAVVVSALGSLPLLLEMR
jgi:hypothetical protein